MERARKENDASFACGKALTAILSNLSRRRNMGIALSVWQWMETTGIQKNVFHYNSLISVCEKMRENKRALRLLDEMDEKGIQKNEVTYVQQLYIPDLSRSNRSLIYTHILFGFFE